MALHNTKQKYGETGLTPLDWMDIGHHKKFIQTISVVFVPQSIAAPRLWVRVANYICAIDYDSGLCKLNVLKLESSIPYYEFCIAYAIWFNVMTVFMSCEIWREQDDV